MALPNIPYATNTTPQMINLDQTFAALGLLVTVPCSAAGTNAITLTPASGAPTVSAYANFMLFSFAAAASSSGVVTLQVGSLTALKLYRAGGVTQATTGDIVAGQLYTVAFQASLDGNAGGFVITSAIIAPSSTTGFSASVVSPNQTLPVAAGLLTYAHGLGSNPVLVQVAFKCITGEAGWTAGDVQVVAPTADGSNRGFVVWSDATNIYLRVGSGGLLLMNQGSGIVGNLTIANWSVVFTAAIQ